MLAVLVPPSAWRTSQSSVTCCSTRTERSVTARRLRPMRRWISWVRPDWRPLAASRSTRSGEEPGNIEYSAVTQPLPVPRSHLGASSENEAVQRTAVRPILTRTEPGANLVKSRSSSTGRSSSGCGRRPARPTLGHTVHVFPTSATSTGPPKAAVASATGKLPVDRRSKMGDDAAAPLPALAAVTPACLALRCCKDPSSSRLKVASTRANWMPSPRLLNSHAGPVSAE